MMLAVWFSTIENECTKFVILCVHKISTDRVKAWWNPFESFDIWYMKSVTLSATKRFETKKMHNQYMFISSDAIFCYAFQS